MDLARTPSQGPADAVRAGHWLVGIALIHAVFGLWFGRAPLIAIARDGFWDAVNRQPGRGLVFWFLLMSPLVAMLGQLLVWGARTGHRPPRLLGWELLLVAIGGVVSMPASGFWLLMIPAALLLRRKDPRL